jgi:DnaJ-class molecular chaperone
MNNKKFSEVELCGKCKGTGKLKVGNLREMHNHDIDNCPYCDGEGSMIKVTTIEYLKKTKDLILQLIPAT